MGTRQMVDPEMLSGLDFFPDPASSSEALPHMRQVYDALFAAAPIPEGVRVDVEERRIAGAEGHEIGVLIYKPDVTSSPRPAVLHIHGGGYVIGSAKMNHASNIMMAANTDCVVVSVDYRLSPETRHPGPIEDCYAALKWLHASAGSFGIDRNRIAVAGESAGGGLAAALAVLARDRGEVRLVHQHLTYPMIDDRTCTAGTHPYAGEFVFTPAANYLGWSSLLGQEPGSEGVSPYAAAARTEDLSGLPSSFIMVGALDLFVEENMEYARRLIRAGVTTELHVYPGAYHGFDMVPDATVSQAARRASADALKRALRTAPPATAGRSLSRANEMPARGAELNRTFNAYSSSWTGSDASTD